MNAQEARDFLGEEDTFTLFADGFDEAFIGLGQRNHQYIAIYSMPLAIGILAKQIRSDCAECSSSGICDEDHWDEARDTFGFNTLGAYVGEGTPLWLDYEGELVFE